MTRPTIIASPAQEAPESDTESDKVCRMTNTSRTRELRLRRAADRQDLTLSKIRRMDPHALDYGRYRLLDARRQDVLGVPHGVTLDDVEQYLTTPRGRGMRQ